MTAPRTVECKLTDDIKQMILNYNKIAGLCMLMHVNFQMLFSLASTALQCQVKPDVVSTYMYKEQKAIMNCGRHVDKNIQHIPAKIFISEKFKDLRLLKKSMTELDVHEKHYSK